MISTTEEAHEKLHIRRLNGHLDFSPNDPSNFCEKMV